MVAVSDIVRLNVNVTYIYTLTNGKLWYFKYKEEPIHDGYSTVTICYSTVTICYKTQQTRF